MIGSWVIQQQNQLVSTSWCLASILLLFLCSTPLVYAQSTTYYVGATNDPTASDSAGYGTRVAPFATAAYAAKQLDGIGGTVVLLDGEYTNTNFRDGDIWKNENTIRINNVHGTESNPIVVKGDTPTGHTIRGDSTNIFQLRVSSHFVLEDLNIIGEVENIPLQDAWDHRFDYKIEGDDTVYQRADPSLSAEEIEVMTFDDISTLTVIRPSYYTTNGLLVQSSRYVTVRNCQVSFAPGTGLRVQSSDYVTVEDNTVHNNSRRSSVGNHGMVIHSVTNNVGGVTINDEGYRIHIVGNTVYSNYNEVYSWSELKTFITPHIDEGKGITIQKTDEATFDNGTGRILIANNVVYSNGFSGVHTNFATKVDIYHNTAVENSFTGDGVNVGISVSDSSKVNVMNNVALSTNTFGGFVYNTDADDLVASEIVFASNVAVGNLSSRLNAGDFIITNAGDLGLQGAPDYRLASNTPVAGQGSSAVLTAIPLDKDGVTRANPPDPGAYEILGVSTAVPSTQNSQAPSKSSATTAPSSIPSKIASQLPSAFPSGKPSKLPTMSPTDAPFATPSLAPVFVPTSSCVDSPLRVMANGAARSCVWVAKNTESRCTLENVASHCPVTCNACSSNQCSDSAGIFVLENGLTKPCDWVARSNTSERCALEGVEDTCRQTCGSCVGSTVAPAATPSAAPVSVSSGSCVDSPLRMMVDGRSRSCVWVARTNTESRCALENVASHCPVTCNACSSNQCSDSSSTFVLENGDSKRCDWVARLNTSVRCALEGVEDTCRQTCGSCVGSTVAPAATPSAAPVSVSSGSCVDSPLRMMVDGRSRSCVWVARTNTESRCALENVASHCPVTCNACSSNQCSDSSSTFVLENGLTKPCDWVARLNTSVRCALEGVEDTCRQTCGTCTAV